MENWVGTYPKYRKNATLSRGGEEQGREDGKGEEGLEGNKGRGGSKHGKGLQHDKQAVDNGEDKKEGEA